jgi:hypothetical protein
MKQWWLCILLAGLFTGPTQAGDAPSSVTIGVYYPKEKALLAPVFMNSVTTWLRRYEPTLVERSDEHVRMQVKYDYLYDVELTVKTGEFEVRVTLAQAKGSSGKAHKQSGALAAGVVRMMGRSLARERRDRDRWKN